MPASTGAAAAAIDSRVVALEARADASSQRERALESRLEELARLAASLEARAEASSQRERALESRLEELARRAASAESRGEDAAAQLAARIDAQLASRPSAGATASADLGTSAAVLERLERAESLVSQSRAGLSAAQHELSEHARLFDSRKARIESLEARLARVEQDAKVVAPNRSLEGIEARLAVLEARPAPPSAPVVDVADTTDPLRAIKGVGPRYAQQLRALGLDTVESIAALDAAALEALAPQLGMTPARLHKAGWVESARALIASR